MSKVRYWAAVTAIVFTTVVFLSAQTGSQGTVTVSVSDQSGGVVPGADLTLQDLATNDIRKAATQSVGTYSFVGLNVGTYKLTVSKAGYETTNYDSVTVHASRVTDVNVTLPLGKVSEVIEVTANAAPLVDATSSSIGVTIDLKQIEDLPITGRDIFPLVMLAAGWANTPAAGTGAGTFNGLPGGAIVGANVDGVPAITGRMRSAGYGYGTTAIETRVENIAEMTVQTDQIDLSQGFGTDVQINFVTRRGSNKFHGRAFDNFQNDGLNANAWYNDATLPQIPKSKLIKNDFGVSLGGPIWRDKLFFFGSYSEFKQPGTTLVSTSVLTPQAQLGNITYQDVNGNYQPAVNVLTIAQQAGNYSNADTTVAAQQANINNSLKTPGATVVLPVTGQDPNLETVNFQVNAPVVNYYPAIRIDYDLSQKQRLWGAWNLTKQSYIGAYPQAFPGSDYAWQTTSFTSKAYTTAIGYDWTVKPTLINQLRAGFLYNNAIFSPEALTNPPADREVDNTVWALGTSGSYPVGSQTPYYPLFNASDTVTWQHQAHTFSFGFQWYREQDHYFNPPVGWSYDVLGLAGGDPALNTFEAGPNLPNINPNSQWVGEVQNLYATLTGDMLLTWGERPLDPKNHTFDINYGSFSLDELLQATGLFFQDSYRIRPNLTLNYGIRWDFVGDDHDLTGSYHGSSLADLYGPSGIGNEFMPGTLTGTENPTSVASNHQYNPFHKTPQPSLGIAWSPNFSDGLLAKLTGGPGQTVVRVGYSLRDYLEGQQNFWSYASDFGSYFYQSFARYGGPAANASTGTYLAGTFHLEQDTPASGCETVPGAGSCPPFITAPTAYQNTVSLAALTFSGQGEAGMNPHIQVPYIQSWNVGIERSLGRNNALELRYVGNRGIHEWIAPDLNEVNIFENGFLKQFKQAQTNLALNNANPSSPYYGTFAYSPATAGEAATPIFDAAFSLEGSGLAAWDYSNGSFIADLQHGAAGSLAEVLAGQYNNPFYLCSMVGTSFGPCATAGFTNAGTYPANFFQVNPFQAGNQVYYLNSVGYSTYNSLQVEFRQKAWHGMQFNANYTWGKTLGTSPQGNISSQVNYYTLRNTRMNYQPSAYDIRQNFNAFGTYDLPFGAGKTFLNRTGSLNRLVGGWTVGTIFKYQTGNPFQLYGGYDTYNDVADGGVNLTNITVKQLQHDVGVWRVPGVPYVDTFNPSIIATNNASANPNYLTPNTTPGTLAPRIWLYGPHYTNTDLSISKKIAIRERLACSLQGEFLNAFNHPSFGTPYGGSSGVGGGGFGEAGTVNGPRAIELRANFEF
jgi:hypothetical protein